MNIKYTDQQALYLAEVASGKTLELVAKDNNVSKETVSYQLRGLKEAVGASTLPNLVAKGIQNKIIAEQNDGYAASRASK